MKIYLGDQSVGLGTYVTNETGLIISSVQEMLEAQKAEMQAMLDAHTAEVEAKIDAQTTTLNNKIEEGGGGGNSYIFNKKIVGYSGDPGAVGNEWRTVTLFTCKENITATVRISGKGGYNSYAPEFHLMENNSSVWMVPFSSNSPTNIETYEIEYTFKKGAKYQLYYCRAANLNVYIGIDSYELADTLPSFS